MKKLKIALVHDYIKEYGGAERVLETLHEIFPDAPIYTSVYLPRFLGPHRERLARWDIRTSWLQNIPFVHKLISPLRLLSPLVFASFDLSEFDVVIVSATGAYEPNMIRTKTNGSGAIHICYCHTPPRYLYGYATARNWKKNKLVMISGALMNHFLRMVDFSASQRVDYFLANSKEVSARIKKFYRRESSVIYPPVDIKKDEKIDRKQRSREEYLLTGGRLARAKHIDLIIQACLALDIPLKVFGRGFAGYENELRQLVSSNDSLITFMGEVSDEEREILMQQAKAFIFAGEDEDFGITPIEAMSFGLPVIAYRSGGVKETIRDGVTGVFFTELSIDSLKSALVSFEKMKIDPNVCIEQAKLFSKERFVEKILSFVGKYARVARS